MYYYQWLGEGGYEGDGDITKQENLDAFRDYVLECTENKGVHFVMADGVSWLASFIVTYSSKYFTTLILHVCSIVVCTEEEQTSYWANEVSPHTDDVSRGNSLWTECTVNIALEWVSLGCSDWVQLNLNDRCICSSFIAVQDNLLPLPSFSISDRHL